VGGAGGGAPQLVIWGTDVDVNRCKERFKRFLERYIDPNIEQDEKFDGIDVDEPVYLQRLEEVLLTYLLTYLRMYLLSCFIEQCGASSQGGHTVLKVLSNFYPFLQDLERPCKDWKVLEFDVIDP